MKKVLFTATVDSHILAFHIPYLKYFKEQGYEVHVATNSSEEIPYCDKKIPTSFERSPFRWNNIKAIFSLKKVINHEGYELIHCHTPMGGVVTRLAAISARKKQKTKVFYTAHGFHFYQGAPFVNWLLFYPIEKILSHFTDTLITMNSEDYELAKKKFKIRVEFVNGVGVNEEKLNVILTEKEKDELRKSLNLEKDDFVMIYPAELTKRKNQKWLINTLKPLMDMDKHIKLLLPGKDSSNGLHQRQIDALNLNDSIRLLGFRKDIPELLRISDLAISSSNQEGLPVNIMEAMYVNLPIVATNCRGNRDLVVDGKNGYLVEINDSEDMLKKIKRIKDKQLIFEPNDMKPFQLETIMMDMICIYKKGESKNEEDA